MHEEKTKKDLDGYTHTASASRHRCLIRVFAKGALCVAAVGAKCRSCGVIDLGSTHTTHTQAHT